MRKIILTFYGSGKPLIIDKVTPNEFHLRNLEELKDLPIRRGNRTYRLSRFFKVEEEGQAYGLSDIIIIVEGSDSRLVRLGEAMEGGSMIINGDAGMHLGASMIGGEIKVNGNVDNWCGAEMKGGAITVNGDAESFLGSNYIGNVEGMSGGIIKVKGSVKDFAGVRLNGGEIVIEGSCGDFLGYYMKNGKITVKGKCGVEIGSRMRGGVINIFSKAVVGLGFIHDKTVKELFEDKEYELSVFRGDMLEDGEGEIRIPK